MILRPQSLTTPCAGVRMRASRSMVWGRVTDELHLKSRLFPPLSMCLMSASLIQPHHLRFLKQIWMKSNIHPSTFTQLHGISKTSSTHLVDIDLVHTPRLGAADFSSSFWPTGAASIRSRSFDSDPTVSYAYQTVVRCGDESCTSHTLRL